MSKKYGYYEAMDLDYLNRHPDAPIMFRPVRNTWWITWVVVIGISLVGSIIYLLAHGVIGVLLAHYRL